MAEDLAARLERLADINRRFEQGVPHNRALGLVLTDIAEARAEMRLPYSERLIGNPDTRVLHGGAISALMDATCGIAVFMALPRPMAIATLDLRTDYLKPAAPDRDVVCRAHCYKVTRSVAFVRAVAFQGDEADPIAASTGSFMLGTRSTARKAAGDKEDE